MIEDLAGQLIGGRYRIRELVGIGGMDSTVWKAWQTGTERVVAVKVLPAAEEAAAKRFARGARIAANLNHPNCTVVHDYGRSDDGKLFLVMEYLTGQVLQEILGPEGMSAADTIHVADQVLQALEHAHGQRAVHRDLKPDNLFLSRKNDDPLHVKILDFGIAKYVEEDPDNTSAGEDAPSDGFEDLVTEQRQVCGTPQYMAPEQVVGARIDGRTDLYSLAVVMYRMLTGRLPFDGKTRYELYQKHLQEVPKPFHDVRPDLVFPERLEQIVLKTLSKRPDQRFQSAAEMRKALAAVEVHDERQRRGVRPRVSLKHTSPQEPRSAIWGGSDRDTDPEGAAGVIVSSAVAETILPASPTVLPGGMWTLSQQAPDLVAPHAVRGDPASTGRIANAPPPLPGAVARARSALPDAESVPPQLPPRATGPVPDVRPARVVAVEDPQPQREARKSQDVRRSMPEEPARIPTPPAAAKLPTPSLGPGKNTSTNLLSDAVMRHPAGRSSLAVAPEVPRSTETEPNRAREAGEKRRRRLGVVAVLAGAFLVGVGGVALTMQLVGDDEEPVTEGSAVAPVPITTEAQPAAVTANKVTTPEPAPAKLPEVVKEPAPTPVETTTAGALAGHTLSEVPVAPAPAPAKVAIKIDSVPPGALVSEGLTILGPTPLSISVAPGRHVLSLERAGFVNAIVEIDASLSATAPVERKLVLVPTRVTPQTPPRTPQNRQPTDPNKLLQNLTPEVKEPPKQDPPKVETPKQPDPPKNPQVKLLDDKGTGTTDPGKKPTIKLLEDEGSAPKKPQVKVLEE